MGIKSEHATLLNILDAMALCPAYALRRNVLREAEALILHQEKRIKELEKANAQKETGTGTGNTETMVNQPD